jgi:hypothetical protein
MTIPHDKSEVLKAVNDTVAQMKARIDDLGLRVHTDSIEPSYGGWLLPAHCEASPAARKSYELHRLLEAVEDAIYDKLNSTVTIVLNPTNGKG